MFGRRKIKELETKLESLEERVKALENPPKERAKALENPSKTTQIPKVDKSTEGNIGIIFDEWLNGERKGESK